MIRMSTKASSSALLLLPSLLAAASCGDSDGDVEPELVPRTFEAGELDEYGCPYIEPTPWTDEDEHQLACGEGCAARGVNDSFVACNSPNVPDYPYDGVSQVVICLRSPIDGNEYRFGDERAAWPQLQTCWRRCGSDLPELDVDHCFEAAELN